MVIRLNNKHISFSWIAVVFFYFVSPTATQNKKIQPQPRSSRCVQLTQFVVTHEKVLITFAFCSLKYYFCVFSDTETGF